MIYDLRFTIYDLRFMIYDLRFTIYDLRFRLLHIHIGKWFWEILFVYPCLVGHQTRFFYCLVHVWCPTKRT